MSQMMMKTILLVSLLLSFHLLASEKINYSGRLVQTNGAPVAGPVNLIFNIYEDTDLKCSKTANGVSLSNGVFNVELDLSTCGGVSFSTLISTALNTNKTISISVTDNTSTPKTYPKQKINAVPFALYAMSASGTAAAVDDLTDDKFAGITSHCGAGKVLKTNADGSFTCGDVGTGLVTGVLATAPLHIAGTGTLTLSLDDSGVLPGAYSKVTVNAKGLVTTATNLVAADIPSLSATKITSGEFDLAQIPSITNAKLAGAITGDKLVAGTLIGSNLADTSIGLEKLNASASGCLGNQILKYDLILSKVICTDLPATASDTWTSASGDIYRPSGNVGVGTNTPHERLTVSGNIALESGNTLKFYDADNTNFVGLQAANNVSANKIWTLPASDGSNGQALITNGSGVLSWSTLPVVSVTTVNTKTGDVVLTTSDIGEGTRLYYTDVRAKAAALAASLTGYTLGSNTSLDATDTVLGAFGKVQEQLNNKINTNATLTGLSALDAINGLVVQTASHTFVKRSLGVVDATRVTITNADGVSGNPTIDINTTLFPSPIAGDSGKYLKATGANSSVWSMIDGGEINNDSIPYGKLQGLAGAGCIVGQVLKANGVGSLSCAWETSTASSSALWETDTTNAWRTSGNVGIGTNNPASKLQVAGGVQIGTDGATCDATKAGTLRYNASKVEYCNGANWLPFGVAGAGITNLNGSTDQAQTFGTPGTSGTAPNWNTSGSTHTLNIPLASAAGVTAGLLSKAEYDALNAKLGTSTNLTGDVSGTYDATSVDKIKGKVLNINVLTGGDFLRYDGINWVNTLLVAADIPSLNAAKITTGILPIERGGTNSGTTLTNNKVMVSSGGKIVEAPALSNGQLLIGSDSAAPVAATLTAGTGVTITNSAGGITISAAGSGGTVTNVTGTAPLSVANNTTTPAISIVKANTTTDGYLSASDWNIFNTKEAALTASATTAYYRGDKTWQALTTTVVPEGTNLYFTDQRARTALTASLAAKQDTLTASLPVVITGNVLSLGTDSITNAYLQGTPLCLANQQLSYRLPGGFVCEDASGASGGLWTLSGSDVYRASGNVGIGTSTPLGALDISSGDHYGLVIGADGDGTRVDGTNKSAGIVMPHYNNANSPIGLINSQAGAVSNVINIGGGSAAVTAATEIYFYTASNNVTSVGNTVMSITKDSNVGIGTDTPTSRLQVAGGVQIGTDAVGCNAAKAGTLRYNATKVEYCNGSSWQAFGVSGAGITSFNGSASSTQSLGVPGTAGTAPGWITAAGVHTLNIPMASAAGVTAGLITKAQYDAFNSKETSIATGTAVQYYRGDKTWADFQNDVRSATLTAFSPTAASITAASNIVAAFGQAQGQINALQASKANAASIIDWSIAGLQTIDPSRLYMGVANANKVMITSSTGSVTVSSVTTTQLGYLSGVSSGIQTQLDALTASQAWTVSGGNAYRLTGNVGVGVVPTTKFEVDGQITSRPYGAAAGQTGQILLRELATNGTNAVTIKAPDLLAGDLNLILPATNGTNGQILSTNGSGVLSWTSLPAGVDPLTATLAGYAVGTNTALAASDTILAAFQKVQGQLNAKDAAIATGTAAQYYRGDKTWANFQNDVRSATLTAFSPTAASITAASNIVAAFGQAQGQINALQASKQDTLTASLPVVLNSNVLSLGTNSITGSYLQGNPLCLANEQLSYRLPGGFVCEDASGASGGLWTLNGSDVYRASGNVGIRTATPTVALAVGGSLYTNAGSEIHLVNPTGFSTFAMGEDFNNFASVVWMDTGNSLNFSTKSSGTSYNNTLVLRNGRVGIGAESMNYDLGIVGNATPRTIGVLRNTAGGPGSSLSLVAGGGTAAAPNVSGGDLILSSGISTGNASSNIEFKTAGAGSVGSSDNTPATRMSIDGYGRTSIASSYPNPGSNNSTILTLKNTHSQFQLGNYSSVSTFSVGSFSGASNTNFYMTGITGIASDMLGTTIQTDDFQVTNDGSSKFRINSSGNVGIGQVNPGAKLEVAGQVKITGGSPGLNKVLTSDADGLASWVLPVTGTDLSAGATINGIVYPANTTQTLQVPLAPVLGSDVANKTYVDSVASPWIKSGTKIYYDAGQIIAGNGTIYTGTDDAFIVKGDTGNMAKMILDRGGSLTELATNGLQFAINKCTSTNCGGQTPILKSDFADNLLTLGASDKVTVEATGAIGLRATSPIKFYDLDNTNFVALKSPDTVASDLTFTLPSTYGTNGQVLTTNGTGALLWATAGGGLPAADGTAAAPSIAFTNSPATGLYRYSSNAIGISTAGIDRMKIMSNGAVIMGPNPDSYINGTLYVNSSDNSRSSLHLLHKTSGTNTGTDGFEMALSGTDVILGNQENGYMSFKTNNTERMKISASGQIAIGGAAPTTDSIIVKGSTTSLQRFVNAATGETTNDGLHVGITNDMRGWIYNFENAPLVFGTNNQERMTISSLGYVGIGATTPSSLLHVSGSAFYPLTLESSSAGVGLLFKEVNSSGGNEGIYATANEVRIANNGSDRFKVTNTGAEVVGQITIAGGTPGAGKVLTALDATGLATWATAGGGLPAANGTAAAPSIAFTNSLGTGLYTPIEDTLGFSVGGAERMRIASNGNIGIGTNAPSSTVEINAPMPDLRVESTNQNLQASMSIRNGGLADIQLRVNGDSVAGNYLGVPQAGMGVLAYGGLTGLALSSSSSPILFGTNGSERARITPAGDFGIGTSSPRAKLDVSGTVLSKATDNGSGTTIDFSTGNLQYSEAGCGAFALNNMKSGGSYTLAVQGAAGGTCSFTATGFTVKPGPAVLEKTANKHILFTFLVMGSYIYVASIDGY